jgi:hypothetical protein
MRTLLLAQARCSVTLNLRHCNRIEQQLRRNFAAVVNMNADALCTWAPMGWGQQQRTGPGDGPVSVRTSRCGTSHTPTAAWGAKFRRERRGVVLRHDCPPLLGLGARLSRHGPDREAWNTQYAVVWTPLPLQGRPLQQTAGIGALRALGRERAAEHHGPPAAESVGAWAVSKPRNLRAIASTLGPAGRRDPHGPGPGTGRESCESRSSGG